VHFQFDEQGFDVGPDGKTSGFRSYGFYSLPGMFLPTNGSMGDALIRLPEPFQQDARGHFDREVYSLNLAILEALIKREDVTIPEVDETRHGVDLDKNGKLEKTRTVRFDWDPLHGRTMSYVGRAQKEQLEGRIQAAAGLFPEGTEFLHSVRYLDVEDGKVRMAARFKELRYARKETYLNYSDLEQIAQHEAKEDAQRPDSPRELFGDEARGIRNGLGWRYQAFIEDAEGKLRPQNYEELAYCVGCHSGLGITSDGIFSFARKLDGEARAYGWFHPSQEAARASIGEPQRKDGQGEYSLYLRQAQGADDMQANDEARARFFALDGAPNETAFRALAGDISALTIPSPARALALDKAYRVIVREQSYTRGRDATLTPVMHVHRTLSEDQPTGISEGIEPPWRAISAKNKPRGG
jgi:hypothetical protein